MNKNKRRCWPKLLSSKMYSKMYYYSSKALTPRKLLSSKMYLPPKAPTPRKCIYPLWPGTAISYALLALFQYKYCIHVAVHICYMCLNVVFLMCGCVRRAMYPGGVHAARYVLGVLSARRSRSRPRAKKPLRKQRHYDKVSSSFEHIHSDTMRMFVFAPASGSKQGRSFPPPVARLHAARAADARGRVSARRSMQPELAQGNTRAAKPHSWALPTRG